MSLLTKFTPPHKTKIGPNFSLTNKLFIIECLTNQRVWRLNELYLQLKDEEKILYYYNIFKEHEIFMGENMRHRSHKLKRLLLHNDDMKYYETIMNMLE